MKRFLTLAGGLVALANVACSGNVSIEDDASAAEETGQELPPALKDFAAVPKEIVEREYVKTPFGRAHPSCMHRIAEGELVDGDGVVRVGERVVGRLPSCDYAPEIGAAKAQPDVSGTHWITDAYIDAPKRGSYQMFNYASSRVQVPSTPDLDDGQVFYAFPAFMPADYSYLLQPVLQYGSDHAGGGSYWSLSSWAIISTSTPRQVLYTEKLPVSSGDSVVLQLQVTHEIKVLGVTRYRVRITASTASASRKLEVNVAPAALRRLYLGASEMWNNTSCDHFPSYLSFDTLAYIPDTTPWNTYFPVRVGETRENHWPGYCNFGINSFFRYPSSYQVDMTF